MSPDVVIVGAGPGGLLMACELALAGVRPVILELLPERAAEPKANGLVGRVVQALDYRGLYGRLTTAAGPPVPAPYFAFGALPLDMSGWDGNALFTLPVPQRRLEELLEGRARELGAEIRRGHEVVAMRQDAAGVTADVLGPDGPYQLSARFLVGADGGHSSIRKQAGIGFPGVSDDGFVSRSGEVTIHPPVAVPGTGRLASPAPSTACSPSRCSGRGCTGSPCTSGASRPSPTARPCRSASCRRPRRGSSAVTCR
jgi:2-polyprenyl-6-methoxyphenol hydroxylase-like FAD-dependent oxidoreductase